MSKSKESGGVKLPMLGHKEVRLINILAELCACDPADILWDGSGSADTVVFNSDDASYLLKLSRDNVEGTPSNCLDFRVRVMIA